MTAFSFVQAKTAASAADGTSATATWNTPPTPGNLLIAIVNARTLPADPTADWWILDGSSGGVDGWLNMWHRVCGEADSSVFTSGLASSSWEVCLLEYAGNDLLGSIDDLFGQGNRTAGASTYNAGGTLTYSWSLPNSVCIYAVGLPNDNKTFSGWTNSFTERCDVQGLGTNATSLGVADHFHTSVVTDDCTVTLSGAAVGRPNTIIATYQATEDERYPSNRVMQQNAGGW